MKKTIDDNDDIRIYVDDEWISFPASQVEKIAISRSNAKFFDVYVNNEYLEIKRKELP